MLPAGIDVDVHHPARLTYREIRIVQRHRDLDPDTPQRVDDLAKRLEVHADPVIDRLPNHLRYRGRRQVAPARVRLPFATDVGVVFVIGTDGVGTVQLAHHEPVPGECRDLDPQVAWQRNHHRLACRGTDGQDHDGVGQIRPVVARSTVAEQQDVDAFVVLDLPAEGTGLVTLRLDQRDEVLWLGVWRDGMNRRPGTKDDESRDQQSEPGDRGHRGAAVLPHTLGAERRGCAPPARLPYQSAAREFSESRSRPYNVRRCERVRWVDAHRARS